MSVSAIFAGVEGVRWILRRSGLLPRVSESGVPVDRPRYGDARRAWHPDFVEYMYRIVEHPNYAGMPCTIDDDGKIDWIIPSYRPEGSKNWDGNGRRREWWRNKAQELGIEQQGRWISKVAKAIHPFGAKPCQTCGRIMRITYAYPTARTISRLNADLPDDAALEVESLLDIFEVADHLVVEVGLDEARRALTTVFPVLAEADTSNAEALKEALGTVVVAREPRGWLSPGAMANPPDRLDGFHTYNLCCRSKQDTGRASENLRTYGVDRRAFEQWCEGDWSAANALMNVVTEGTCPRCRQDASLTADHVGPISLGFRHTPRFEAICLACNSAKNNRMSLRDVAALRDLEAAGEPVTSWQAAELWEACKDHVTSEEQALVLSRLLRASQHHYLLLLNRALEHGVPDVLLQFLTPEYADHRTEFEGLDPATLQYDAMVKVPRQETFSRSLGARMVRIAFNALQDYASRRARKVHFVEERLLEAAQAQVDEALRRAASSQSAWRAELKEILGLEPHLQDARLAQLFRRGYKPAEDFTYVKAAFAAHMSVIAEILARRFVEGRAGRIGDDVEELLGELPSL